jgi:hypothetical protein
VYGTLSAFEVLIVCLCWQLHVYFKMREICSCHCGECCVQFAGMPLLYSGRKVPTFRGTGRNKNEQTMVIKPVATPIKFNMSHEDTQVFLIIGSKYMLIYLSTAVGLTPSGNLYVAVHIYT